MSKSGSGTDDDPHEDCIVEKVSFVDRDVNENNFLNILPAGVTITADNIEDGDNTFTVGEVGFIDNGAPTHKGIGANGQTISPGSHVDTQTGYKPTASGEKAEELKISFSDAEFPDGLIRITVAITRLFPNEGTGDDNESFRWTALNDGAVVATDTYEASNSDPELFGVSHAVAVTIDPGVEFDEVILKAIPYNDGAPDNGGTRTDSSDFLLAGFEYKFKTPDENRPPDAEDDWAHVCEDQMVIIDVLDNDSDPDGDDIHIVWVEDPANGTAEIVEINGKEFIKYTPDPDFHGVELFDYKIKDEYGLKDTATIDVIVKPKNDNPEDPNERKMITEDQIIEGVGMRDFKLKDASDVDGDDIDVESLDDWNVMATIDGNDVSADFSVMLVGFVAQLEYLGNLVATFTVNPETGGELIESNDDDFWEDLDTGDTVKVQIGYTVTDGNGGTDTSEQTILIKGVDDENRPPDANDDWAHVCEDQMVIIDVLDGGPMGGKDTDPDDDDLTIISVEDPANGTAEIVEINGKQFIKYTPDPDFHGVELFDYTIEDEGGLRDTATVDVIVKPKNDDPVDPNERKMITEDQIIEGVGMRGFKLMDATDVDGDDIDVESLDNWTVMATIDGMDVSADFAVVFDVAMNDDLLATLSFQGGDVALFTVNPESGGELIASLDDAFWEDLDTGDTVKVQIGYTVTDGNGGTDTSEQTILIKGVDDENRPPDANDDWAHVCEDQMVIIDVLDGGPMGGKDTDPDDDDLTIISVEDPANGTAEIVEINGKQFIKYTPDPDFHGVELFDYTIEDEGGLRDTATVDVIVKPKNDDPVDPDERKMITEDQVIESVGMRGFKLMGATDVDGDDIDVESLDNSTVMATIDGMDVSGDFAIVFSVAMNGNLLATLSFQGGDVALFTVNPEGGGELIQSLDDPFWESLDDGDTIKVEIGYTVTDGNGGTDTSTQTILIKGVDEPNSPPRDPDEMKVVLEDELIAGVNMPDFKLEGATDPDGDDVDIQSLDDWSVIASIGGQDVSGDFNVILNGFIIELYFQGGLVAEFTVDPETGGETLNSSDDDFWNALDDTDFVEVKVDYTVTDNNGGTDTSTQTVLIKGEEDEVENRPPEDPDEIKVVFEDELIAGVSMDDFKLAGATDPDADDVDIESLDDWSVIASIGGLDASGDFNVILNGFNIELYFQGGLVALFVVDPETGAETLNSSDDDFWNDLEAVDFVQVEVDYTVTDGNGGTDMSTQTIVIKGEEDEVENLPPVPHDDCAMTQEGVAVAVNVLINDDDPDGNNANLMVNSFMPVFPATTAFGGIITDPNPNDAFITYTPVDGFVGFDTFTYDIMDEDGLVSLSSAQVIVMVSKVYDLSETFLFNGTNNKHHQGKDGLLNPLTGALIAAPFEGKDPEPIHVIEGKDALEIAPTGLGLAVNPGVHVSSLDYASNFTLNDGLMQYQVDFKVSFPDPIAPFDNSGFATFVDFDTNEVRKILVDFTDVNGSQANFVVTLGTNSDDTIGGDTPTPGGDPVRSQQDLIYGYGGDDNIRGGNDDDVIYGDEKTSFRDPGNDTITGGEGRDLIYGDNLVLDSGFKGGQDMIFGDQGDDVIWGDARFRGPSDGGEDLIRGGAGRDLIYGDGAVLQAFSSAASDKIFGDDGVDDIYGDAWMMVGGTGAVDEIHGGADGDFIYGDAKWMEGGSVGANDAVIPDNLGSTDGKHQGPFGGLFGEGGDDHVYGDGEQLKEQSVGGDDEIHGGAGGDRLYGDAGAIFDIEGTLIEAGLIDSTGGDDHIKGDEGDDFIFGDAEVGQDTVAPGALVAGNDHIEGGLGNDRMYGDFKLVLDAGDMDVTAAYLGGADTFLFDFDGASTDLGDDFIFDYDFAGEGDTLTMEQLLDMGGGIVTTDAELEDVTTVSSTSVEAVPSIAIAFDNGTSLTMKGISFIDADITSYIDAGEIDVNYA